MTKRLNDMIYEITGYFQKKRIFKMMVFTTPNVTDDRMVSVYERDGLTVEWFPSWNYCDIIGLNDEEKKDLFKASMFKDGTAWT